MTNEVLISYADQDQIVVAGNTPVIAISTSARGNGTLGLAAANAADLDKQKFRRYFARSGLYKFKLIYAKAADAGKLDIGLDSSTTNILSQLDLYNGSTTYNNIIEKTIEIARGAHDIVFLINGKNASSSDYTFLMQLVQFDLIAEYPVAGETGAPGTDQLIQTLELTLTDESTLPTTGVKITDGIPYTCVVTDVHFLVKTAGTGATLIEADTLLETAQNSDTFNSIFSTRPTIDASEFTSKSATTPPVLNPAVNRSIFPIGIRMQGKIQALDSNSLARGLKVQLTVNKIL